MLLDSVTVVNSSPLRSLVGASVTINGTNFSGATAVQFNGTTANYTVNSSTVIQATVPANATTGSISVKIGRASCRESGEITVVAAPTITRLTATSGLGRNSVTINRTNRSG